MRTIGFVSNQLSPNVITSWILWCKKIKKPSVPMKKPNIANNPLMNKGKHHLKNTS
jgi:hypothetical protein